MGQDLGRGNFCQYSNWVYSTLKTHFYSYGGLCRVASAARGWVSLRWDYKALVRVAGNGHQMGLGRVWHMEFQKQNQGLWIEWIHSRGLGMSSSHGEAWIGVPVWCCTECYTALASTPKPASMLSDGTIHGVSREPELDGRDLASTYMLHPLTIALSQISESWR